MTAVITGATGFLGGALARALLSQGTAVRVLARRPQAAQSLQDLGAEVHAGDLDRPETLTGLIPPDATIYHCAARVDLSGPLSDFEKTNVAGTRHLYGAVDQPPRHIVHISSGAVYGAAALGKNIRADRVPADPVSYNFYGRTKLASEAVAFRAAERLGCTCTVLRLGFLYGAGNRPLLDRVEPLMRKRRYVLIGQGDNRIATLDIADAVSVTIAGGTHPNAPGRIFDAASAERVTQREFFARTAEALGHSTRFRTIHPRLAHPLAGMTERVCDWLGRPAPFTRAMVDLLGADQVIDSSALKEELDWQPQVSFEEGMARMKSWYDAQRKETA